jgi:hypothetical protein
VLSDEVDSNRRAYLRGPRLLESGLCQHAAIDVAVAVRGLFASTMLYGAKPDLE